MKFSDYPVKTDDHGFRFAKDDVMVTETEKICLVCGVPTKYVDTISEGHFCSDECRNKFYQEMSQQTAKPKKWNQPSIERRKSTCLDCDLYLADACDGFEEDMKSCADYADCWVEEKPQ